MRREVREALEHIRYVEKIHAERRAIQRETEELDRKLRRGMTFATCAIPVLALIGIAVLVLTDAFGLAIVMLWIAAFLAVAIWFIHRLDRRMRDDQDGDDPEDPTA